jgi:hypothetical protein
VPPSSGIRHPQLGPIDTRVPASDLSVRTKPDHNWLARLERRQEATHESGLAAYLEVPVTQAVAHWTFKV